MILVRYEAGYWVLLESLGDFVVASPRGFQEFWQLLGGLWAGYLVEGFVGKNPFG
jgi:hypothetical protein